MGQPQAHPPSGAGQRPTIYCYRGLQVGDAAHVVHAPAAVDDNLPVGGNGGGANGAVVAVRVPVCSCRARDTHERLASMQSSPTCLGPPPRLSTH